MDREKFKSYSEKICSNCINKKECQEELRIRLDGSIKCDEYKRKKEKQPIGALIRVMRI